MAIADSTLYLEGVVAARQCYVYAIKDSLQSIPATTYTTVVYNDTITDLGDDYNSSTGIFTAPTDGIYTVSFAILSASTTFTAGQVWMSRLDAGTKMFNGFYNRVQTGATASLLSSDCNALVKLNKNETIEAKIYHTRSSSCNTYVGGADDKYNFLTIARVREL